MKGNNDGRKRNPYTVFPFFVFFLFWITTRAQSTDTLFITLNDAIQRALSHNNQLIASHYASEKADWDKVQALTRLLPVVSFNTRYTWIDDETFALRDFSRYFEDSDGFPQPDSGFFPSFKIPQTVFQNSFYTFFDVNLNLFNWQIINGISLAGAIQEMTHKQQESVRNMTLFNVIRAYLNILYSKEVLSLQEEYLKLSNMNYEKALRMHKAGRYSKIEALRWKVDYQQQKSIVENSRSNLRSANVLLKRLLDIKMLQHVKTEEQIPQRLLEEAERVRQLPIEAILKFIELDDDQLTKVNAALSAAEKNTEVSRYDYRSTYGQFMPNLTLSYSYGWRENNTPALDDYSPQMFMVNLNFPLFSSFRDYAALKSKYNAYQKSRELLRDQIQNTRLVLTETINKIINLRTQIELSQANVEYNEHNYRVVEKQKEKGLVSNIDFIDAKLNLQNARLEAVKNNYDFLAAIIEVYYLLGKIDTFVEDDRL